MASLGTGEKSSLQGCQGTGRVALAAGNTALGRGTWPRLPARPRGKQAKGVGLLGPVFLNTSPPMLVTKSCPGLKSKAALAKLMLVIFQLALALLPEKVLVPTQGGLLSPTEWHLAALTVCLF